MKDGFKIMDSDMHLREPADLWDKYMEPEWRERAPKILSSTARSSAMVLIEGKILQGYKPSYRGGIFDATRIDEEIADYRARGFDAKTQLQAMDREGLDVAALYPSIGLGIMMRDDMDPKLAAAIARAYNNWLYDFCQTDPKRLKGVAMLPLHDPNEAVKEAQRAVGKLGFIGTFARPEPLRNLPWHSRYFDSLWSALEELGVPLGFHSATAAGEVAQIGDRFGDNLLLRHVVSHPMENMMAMVDTIGGGVCERHPKLKLAISGMLLRLGVVSLAPHGQRHGEGTLSDGRQTETERVFQTAMLDFHRARKGIADDHRSHRRRQYRFLHRLSARRLGFPGGSGGVSRDGRCLE